MSTVFRRYRTPRSAAIGVLLLILLSHRDMARPAAAAGPTVVMGSLGGAAYKIEMPARWNGMLILWSHGYVMPGGHNDPPLTVDPLVGSWLLGHGYALVARPTLDTSVPSAQPYD